MKTYHKIHSIYKRDPKTDYKTFLEGNVSRPEFEYLFYNQWLFTEKIDGTNIRVIIGGDTPEEKERTGHLTIEFKGKTDKAQTPIFLLEKLKEIFTLKKLSKMYEIFKFPPEGGSVCLYGEGYGARINKGGKYIPDGVDFILFDIKIGDWWLKREDVSDIADKLNIKTVPLIKVGTLQTAIDMIKSGTLKSTFGDFLVEGLVGRPCIELQDRAGRRIITKIKHRDYGIK